MASKTELTGDVTRWRYSLPPATKTRNVTSYKTTPFIKVHNNSNPSDILSVPFDWCLFVLKLSRFGVDWCRFVYKRLSCDVISCPSVPVTSICLSKVQPPTRWPSHNRVGRSDCPRICRSSSLSQSVVGRTGRIQLPASYSLGGKGRI